METSAFVMLWISDSLIFFLVNIINNVWLIVSDWYHSACNAEGVYHLDLSYTCFMGQYRRNFLQSFSNNYIIYIINFHLTFTTGLMGVSVSYAK